ncbi:MAG: DNA translocase FtsK [Limimaricola sp.]|uniref:DNA translocase FtsK n=1 Tax=Limimaricola sp. TaxID=2211665 RepID=UPI001D259414|nr:DNA translocase FtsK [Limimaricola sp.]MBI1416992.1 DNA translocase FtsK [Limimaricola sp.]
MASYQTRQRDPLLDSSTQAVVERRAKELIGLVLIALGLMAAMMLWSYSPNDPNWMLATDAPVQNWMGRPGAAIAAPVLMVIGWGAWAVALVLLAWGLRLAAHVGEERAVARVIFAPIAVAITSVYASTMLPPASWTHSFGLGGLFGDTVLSVVLTVLPLPTALGLKLAALVAGLSMLGMFAVVLGFTWPEVKQGLRLLMIGLVLAYDMAMRLVGRGAALSARAASTAHGNLQNRRAQMRAAAAAAGEDDIDVYAARAMPPEPALHRPAAAVVRPVGPAPAPAAAEQTRAAQRLMPGRAREVAADHAGLPPEPPMFNRREVSSSAAVPAPSPLTAPQRRVAAAPSGGLRGLVPSLLRRAVSPQMPTPELVETVPVDAALPAPSGDRVRDKISAAIRARSAVQPTPQPPISRTPDGLRIEPSLTQGKGPRPLVLSTFTPPPPLDETLATEDEADPYVIERDVDPTPEMPAYPPVTAPAESSRRVVQHAPQRTPQPSRQAQAEAQPRLQFEETHADYETPPLSLLTNPVTITRHHLSDEALEANARMLESVLDDYGVKGEIVSVRPGPVVTMYELEPAPGLKASRVIGLADDIARSMSALSARVSTVPGRSVIGIELPNANREKVVLREILSARDFGDSQMRLPLALGKDIGGQPIITNLAKMPHLLIAGTTGSGKSVAINTMILSLLYKLTPEECRLIMIDPKMLELSVYDGIPHLLSPVVTDPKKAVVALKWTVGEMEERYRKMSKMGVRNIEGYNGRVRDALSKGEMFSRTVQTGFDDDTGEPIFETEEFAPETLPYIVVIVDEMADLMMVAGKEIEACIQRLAQMARASGIHLIMATQRPSVDVITGTIKANFPTRISFQVTSKIDSRTILGEQGAEQLLGMGDMLYMAGGAKITRIHGPFVSDEEVEEIVNFLKGFGPPDYFSGVVEGPDEDTESSIDAVLGLGGNQDAEDALYDTAVAIVIKDRKCSTSYIQRKLAIGYNKAARLVEQMEEQGVVSSANHVGKREILVPEQH